MAGRALVRLRFAPGDEGAPRSGYARGPRRAVPGGEPARPIPSQAPLPLRKKAGELRSELFTGR